MLISGHDRLRYDCQLVLKDVGERGQDKLRNASVLVVGAGGLGAPALYYLVAAGVGRVGIVDDDVVELSNLQRQILFATADIGRPKAEVAAARLGIPSGPAILHVGDDPGADVVGAQALGWRTALVRIKPEDSSLPVAPAVAVVPDMQIDTVLDLEAALGLHPDAPTP